MTLWKRLFGQRKRECVQLVCSRCQETFNVGVDSFLVTTDDVRDYAKNQGATVVIVGKGMEQAPALAMRFNHRLATEEEWKLELTKVSQICNAIEKGDHRTWRCGKCHAANHYFPVLRKA
ncbi:MAG: hypothetical protein ABSB91_01845 [Sedimentisphaerales bacterium]|jgi:tRNA-dihydrouridine synthase